MIIARVAIFATLFSYPVFADQSGHPVTLWQVQGAHNSIYLLGSIHLLRPQDYPLPAVFEKAYDDAEVLIMEVDMDDLDPFAAQAAFTAHGVLHDDTTLRDLMGEDLYQQASDAAARIDISLDMLEKTEPWYAAITVEILVLNRIGFDPALGIDMHMMSKAAADGKPIHGLETIEEQIQFLDGMPLAAQRNMLLATLEEGAELGDEMDKLIDAWRHGDIGYLTHGLLQSFAEHPELKKAIITDRNARWVEYINALLNDDDDYLIIVGALHLVGDDGLPERLARSGVNIHQLRESPTLK